MEHESSEEEEGLVAGVEEVQHERHELGSEPDSFLEELQGRLVISVFSQVLGQRHCCWE